jgi:hypothetical protein
MDVDTVIMNASPFGLLRLRHGISGNSDNSARPGLVIPSHSLAVADSNNHREWKDGIISSVAG